MTWKLPEQQSLGEVLVVACTHVLSPQGRHVWRLARVLVISLEHMYTQTLTHSLLGIVGMLGTHFQGAGTQGDICNVHKHFKVGVAHGDL